MQPERVQQPQAQTDAQTPVPEGSTVAGKEGLERHEEERAQEINSGNRTQAQAQQWQPRDKPGTRLGILHPDTQDYRDGKSYNRGIPVTTGSHLLTGPKEAIPVWAARDARKMQERCCQRSCTHKNKRWFRFAIMCLCRLTLELTDHNILSEAFNLVR